MPLLGWERKPYFLVEQSCLFGGGGIVWNSCIQAGFYQQHINALKCCLLDFLKYQHTTELQFTDI